MDPVIDADHDQVLASTYAASDRRTPGAPNRDSGSDRRLRRLKPLVTPERPPRPTLSVLDLAIVVAGGTTAQALADLTVVAQQAEALGYHRFWVAEHHNMPSVASTSPPVLIAHLAARTDHIRVGSGGVMLPNHAPLVVAEQFAHARGAPSRAHRPRPRAGARHRPAHTAAAAPLGRRHSGADDFPRDLLDLMGLLGDVRGDGGLWEHFVATPAATSSPQVILLGSSGFSAQLAGILGLPVRLRPPLRHGWHAQPHSTSTVSAFRPRRCSRSRT